MAEHGRKNGPDRPKSDWTENLFDVKYRTEDRTEMSGPYVGRSGPVQQRIMSGCL